MGMWGGGICAYVCADSCVFECAVKRLVEAHPCDDRSCLGEAGGSRGIFLAWGCWVRTCGIFEPYEYGKVGTSCS